MSLPATTPPATSDQNPLAMIFAWILIFMAIGAFFNFFWPPRGMTTSLRLFCFFLGAACVLGALALFGVLK